MNGVNFNVVTPNVNYTRLKDESTDKPTEQVNFKANPHLSQEMRNMMNEDLLKPIKEYRKKHPIKYLLESLKLKRENKKYLKELSNSFNLNNEEKRLIENGRNIDEKREILTRISVSKFFKFFKKAGKKSKEVDKNQQVADFASDAANYFEYKKMGRNIEADIYKERMRKFLES